MARRFGIDIGGVIMGQGDTKNDTSFFSDHYLRTPELDGAFYAIAQIVDAVGPRNVFIVSKAGERTAAKSIEWLNQPFEAYDGRNFFEVTGMIPTPHHVWFCEQRSEKAPIAELLRLTHFIDDKYDVLRHMMTRDVPFKILFGEQDDPIPAGVLHIPDWGHIRSII